jgi:chromosomal replication initiator protein
MDKIDGWTFNGCTSLEYCRIPATITEIGESAFQGSDKFSNLVIPGNVTIKQNAFNGCKGLKALYILGTALTIENGNAFWGITDDSDPDKCPKFYARNSMVNTIKDALKDLISKDSDVSITPDKILSTVSEHMNVSINDIQSTKRSKDIAIARQTVMYLCRNMTDKSLQSIGETVGGKDHATVYNGIKRIEEKIKKDPGFEADINAVINKLNPQQ